jgi:hypothetical protein
MPKMIRGPAVVLVLALMAGSAAHALPVTSTSASAPRKLGACRTHFFSVKMKLPKSPFIKNEEARRKA